MLGFGAGFRRVDRAPEELVRNPEPFDAEDPGRWPSFLLTLRAHRHALRIEGDAESWPDEVEIRMEDIRGRLLSGREAWFDPWTISRPDGGGPRFTRELALQASEWTAEKHAAAGDWPPLPALEAEVRWADQAVAVPVVFEDKHELPVVESARREDERSLIAWFLGLREADALEAAGFAHGVDPIARPESAPVGEPDILSYLIRDFVHALPGIRQQLAESTATETGLRSALLGPRSPVALARRARDAWVRPSKAQPKKTVVATLFQLTELMELVASVDLPPLPDGTTERL